MEMSDFSWPHQRYARSETYRASLLVLQFQVLKYHWIQVRISDITKIRSAHLKSPNCGHFETLAVSIDLNISLSLKKTLANSNVFLRTAINRWYCKIIWNALWRLKASNIKGSSQISYFWLLIKNSIQFNLLIITLCLRKQIKCEFNELINEQ